ncbi:MAG: glycosyltransferase family 2 protein [Lachnospiraceae bacterium]|nr:glycosyltransferase family 2 protein [Lachnospiraceae bacterium]
MISAIIPVYRPDDSFEKCLAMLAVQKEPVSEIILINTRTEDFGSKELGELVSKALSDVKTAGKRNIDLVIRSIEKKDFDHGATRAMGAGMARGDRLLFMTQDAVPADMHLTEELLKGLEHEKTAVCYARQLPNADAGDIERYARAFNYPEEDRYKDSSCIESMGIKAFFCSDVCAMYDRQAYEEVGGFEEKTIFNEDMIFAKHALDRGYGVYYAAGACVYHSHSYSYIDQFRRSFDLAVSHRQFPDVFSCVSSESEGIRYVTTGVKHFFAAGKPFAALDLAFDSGFRYMGYLLGKNFDKLPVEAVKALTLNKGYWERS